MSGVGVFVSNVPCTAMGYSHILFFQTHVHMHVRVRAEFKMCQCIIKLAHMTVYLNFSVKTSATYLI